MIIHHIPTLRELVDYNVQIEFAKTFAFKQIDNASCIPGCCENRYVEEDSLEPPLTGRHKGTFLIAMALVLAERKAIKDGASLLCIKFCSCQSCVILPYSYNFLKISYQLVSMEITYSTSQEVSLNFYIFDSI